jgi:hypothetical protein
MIPSDIERVALLGWKVYPCSNRNKKACIKDPTPQATDDLNQIARWAEEFPRCNWRVVVGPSGLWSLDCDVPPGHAHDGVSALKALVAVHGELPQRPTMRSGGGGIGVFFKFNGERIKGDSGYPAPGIDPRRGRQSQTIPPSIHIATRQPYRWLVAPWTINPPTAPAWLLKAVEEPPQPEFKRAPIDTTDAARNRLYRAANAVMMAGEGGRNATLNARSFQIGKLIGAGLLGEQEAIEALYGAARSIGLDHGEAKATIRSGILSGMRK